MKKSDPKAASKEAPPVQTEPTEPEVPQEGNGTFQYTNGTTYVGNWKLFNGNKLKHGHGKVCYPGMNGKGGETYDGDWQEDKMHGRGRYCFTSGAIYQGEWVNGKMEGQGSMQYFDGTSYNGEWKNGLFHGEGVYVDKDKKEWSGIFQNGSYDSKI